jgi:predicted ATP-dependent protease
MVNGRTRETFLDRYKVPVNELRQECDPSVFTFESTAEVLPLDDVIGQARAEQAIDFGLNMKSTGYNIFVAGPVGTGKATIVGDIVGRHAAGSPTPRDWCLVNNFKDEYRPRALPLPPGRGHDFARTMAKLIADLRSELPKAFDTKDFQDRQAALQERMLASQQGLFDALEAKATERRLGISRTESGYRTIALKDGEPISKEVFAQLPEADQALIKENIRSFQGEIESVEQEVHRLRQTHHQEFQKLMQDTALFVIRGRLNALRADFGDCPEACAYLDEVQADMLENVEHFLPGAAEAEATPGVRFPDGFDFERYAVNLLADRRNLHGAPVILESNPTYQNVFGHIEKRALLGTVRTDFTMVQAGSLLRANGGYLIMEIESVLMHPFVWEALKRALQTQQLCIEEAGSDMAPVISTLRPEPIPLDVKVVLLGSYQIFEMLQNFDSKFDKIFKVRADFDYEVERTEASVQLYARFIARVCREEQLRPFGPDGVAAVVEFGERFVANKHKLSLRFGPIVGILKESDYWARRVEAPRVTAVHVERALRERRFRYNLYEEKIQESFTDQTVLLDVDGEVVGQVNALAVWQVGDMAFGRPNRITAVSFMGKPGVINIEREAALSGRTHDKGVLILAGYLGQIFAQTFPLAVTLSLTFEQHYGEIDGDSASSTELYAILSSLANLPIRQGLAVTGSVNQRGDIQAIGGVNQKVEGYFDVCCALGLTGDQGVLLPGANVRHLALRRDLVQAVREGRFHIYAVDTVAQGITVLTGIPAGTPDPEGRYPADTVFGRVQRKLQVFAERVERFRRGAPGSRDWSAV